MLKIFERWQVIFLVPGRSGSDVVEHHFGHIRQTNSQPSTLECKQATARGSDIGPINNMFSVNSKSNTSGSDVYASEAFSLMKPKVNKKKKKPRVQRKRKKKTI